MEWALTQPALSSRAHLRSHMTRLESSDRQAWSVWRVVSGADVVKAIRLRNPIPLPTAFSPVVKGTRLSHAAAYRCAKRSPSRRPPRNGLRPRFSADYDADCCPRHEHTAAPRRTYAPLCYQCAPMLELAVSARNRVNRPPHRRVSRRCPMPESDACTAGSKCP